VAVREFRNLADADLAVPEAGCVVVGQNGHGKTSLIEAMLYPEVFRSFRGAVDRELVRFGTDGFHVQVAVEAGGSSVQTPQTPHGFHVQAAVEAGGSSVQTPQTPQWGAGGSGQVVVAAGYDARTRQKRVTVNGMQPERLAEAIGIVRGVVLSPTDVRLVAGAPRERRHYLDVMLSLTVKGYVEALAKYRRALRHRGKATPADVETWEHLLAVAGERIWAARRDWAAKWAGRWAEHCVAIGEGRGARSEGRGVSGEGPCLTYAPKTEGGAEALREALARSREKDLARGRTSVGPHRDELRLTLGGHELRAYGSAGQQRTAALALRLVEAEALRDATGEGATLCLDDAFAELDEGRSRRLGALIELMADAGTQIVAAVPKAADLPHVAQALPRWTINDGRIAA
jgi:DNA replication and repair protein RecF